MSFATTNGNYKISEVFDKQDAYPLVVAFQNGILQEISDHDFHGGIFLDNSSGKSKKRTVAALDNMLYIGEESENNVCRNLIVARNRNTGDVRLIEVGNILLKALPEDEQIEKSTDVDQKSVDFTDSRLQLSEAFGSKRQKRMLEQSKKTQIDINAMKEQLEKTVNEKQVDALDMSQNDIYQVNPGLLVEKYAPPRHQDANSIKDVYNIADFLNEEVLETFKITANCVLEDEKYEIEMSEYIVEEIASLRTSPNTDKITTCCLLLYADCIIRYLKDSYKKVTSSSYVLCTYSELINSFVLNNFSMTSDKGRMRPQSLKDKAVCYLLVLLLIAGNYIIRDAGKLSKSVGATVPTISRMAKVVGAHVINDKEVSIVLKLPLAAPPAMASNKRRR